ncbi:hypothetical protein C0J52_16748 [Blattella germanica]|nr:hypothetical protein C0J52_16748 [Blattella germanica]
MGLLLGAYLKKPNTEKISTDEVGRRVICGASSMQGWRVTQEDAHNCDLEYDTNTSFFAVYDGHGGHEVAKYTAQHLPQYLKDCEAYKKGDYTKALKDTFLGFDATLTTPDVVVVLKEIQDNVEEEENIKNLFEEAEMPLEEVMAKYKRDILNNKEKPKKEESCSSGASSSGAGASSSKSGSKKITESENGSADSDEESNEGSKCNNKAQIKRSPSPICRKDHSNNIEEAESDLGEKKIKIEISSPIKHTVHTPDSSGDVKKEDIVKTEDVKKEDIVKTEDVKKEDIVKTEDVKKEDIVKTEDKSSVKGGVDVEVKQEMNGEIGDEESKTGKIKEEDSVSSIPRENGEVVEREGKGKAKTTSSNVEEKRNMPVLRRRQAAELYRALLRDEASDSDSSSDDEGDLSFQGVDNRSEGTTIPGLDSGCTAVVALLKGQELYVANAGDSRCVVCRNGQAVEMSLDHKPEDDIEKTRIVKAGGRVNFDGRVNGGLNLSRALGDHSYKQSEGLSAEEQMITALPDVRTLMIDPKEDEFMILACDGIWNSLSSQEVVDFIRERIKNGEKVLSKICEALFDACLAPDCLGDGTGCDNMTAVIVQFRPELAKATEKRAHSPTSEIDSPTAKHPKLDENEVSSTV